MNEEIATYINKSMKRCQIATESLLIRRILTNLTELALTTSEVQNKETTQDIVLTQINKEISIIEYSKAVIDKYIEDEPELGNSLVIENNLPIREAAIIELDIMLKTLMVDVVESVYGDK